MRSSLQKMDMSKANGHISSVSYDELPLAADDDNDG